MNFPWLGTSVRARGCAVMARVQIWWEGLCATVRMALLQDKQVNMISWSSMCTNISGQTGKHEQLIKKVYQYGGRVCELLCAALHTETYKKKW